MSSRTTLALSSSVSEPPGMMGKDIAGSCAQVWRAAAGTGEADTGGSLAAGYHHDFSSSSPHHLDFQF